MQICQTTGIKHCIKIGTHSQKVFTWTHQLQALNKWGVRPVPFREPLNDFTATNAISYQKKEKSLGQDGKKIEIHNVCEL